MLEMRESSEVSVLVTALAIDQSFSWAVSGAQARATLILPFPEPVLLVFRASPVIYSPGFLKHFLGPLSAAAHVFNVSYPYLRGKIFLSQCRNIQ